MSTLVIKSNGKADGTTIELDGRCMTNVRKLEFLPLHPNGQLIVRMECYVDGLEYTADGEFVPFT